MNGFLSSSEVERLRKEYPEGTRIFLISMVDPYSKLGNGDRGTVKGVDDAGTIHMKWDKGGSLGLIVGEDSFRKLTPEELREESTKNLRELLWEKASKEQSEYINKLKTLSPEEIIKYCYEKVIRDDILLSFEEDYLSDKQIIALLKLDYPLDYCYNEWLSNDCSHMEMLRDTVEKGADILAEENEAKAQKDKRKHEPER